MDLVHRPGTWAFFLTEPARQSLVGLAEQLAQDRHFPANELQFMDHALDRVYGARHAWSLVGSALRIAIALPFHRVERVDRSSYPASYRDRYVAFQSRWTIAVIGNSPAAAVLVGILMLFLSACTLSAGGLSRLLMHGRPA